MKRPVRGKKPDTALWEKEPTNTPPGSFCVSQLLLRMGPALKSGLYIQYSFIGEYHFFPFVSGYQVQMMASGLRMEGCVHFLSPHSDYIWSSPVHTHSLCEFFYVLFPCITSPCFLHAFHSLLPSFCHLFYQVPWGPWWRHLIYDEVVKCLILCPLSSCASLYLFQFTMKFLWWWGVGHWPRSIAECHEELFYCEVPSAVFIFSLVPDLSNLRFLSALEMLGMDSFS